MNDLWPVQVEFIRLAHDAIARGVRRFVITAPTGTGKSRSMAELTAQLVEDDWKVIIFSNRRWLLEQLRETLNKHEIDYGMRASGYSDEDGAWPVQISSLPTERARVLKSKRWRLFAEGRKCVCIVDEAHSQNGPKDREIFQLHADQGHFILGVTATPLDLEGTYEEVLVAGTVSNGVACGALVGCQHFGCDEPDFKAIRGYQEGTDFSEAQLKKLMDKPGLYGRVHGNFERLNPKHNPTLLFADSVEKSLWFAEQFTAAGIPAAHIDGDQIWIAGDFGKTDMESRKALVEASRSGEIRVICNRFVAREGVDMPWIRHIVAATVFGSLGGYLQALGRGLRADVYPDTNALWGPKTHLTIADHGGNYWRHGSVMQDRDWLLNLTSATAAYVHANKYRKNPASQPFTCPQCRRVWPGAATKCHVAHGGCGYELPEKVKRARPVVTAKGDLRLMTGDIYKKQREYGTAPSDNANGPKRWMRMYWRARSPKWSATFRQAFAMFASENNWGYPARHWPLMPKDEYDDCRLVSEVAMDRLNPNPDYQGPSQQEPAHAREGERDDPGNLFPAGGFPEGEEGGEAGQEGS